MLWCFKRLRTRQSFMGFFFFFEREHLNEILFCFVFSYLFFSSPLYFCLLFLFGDAFRSVRYFLGPFLWQVEKSKFHWGKNHICTKTNKTQKHKVSEPLHFKNLKALLLWLKCMIPKLKQVCTYLWWENVTALLLLLNTDK